MFRLDTNMLAIPLYYAAANKGHAPSQMRMALYLEYDKHKDSIKYLKMAMAQNYQKAFLGFFINYVKKKKEYLAEPEIFKKILKNYKNSNDEELFSHVANYYENIENDYKNALKYYKKTILTGQVERLKMFLKYQKHPTKEGREELAKKYPTIYKIVANKIIQ